MTVSEPQSVTPGYRDGEVLTVRPARTSDVPAIKELLAPLVEQRILLAKETVAYYEGIQEFMIAEERGQLLGCGALHVMWQDLAEIRTLAVAQERLGQGVGHRIIEELIARARELGISRLFCLTFEVDFFRRHGFEPITESGAEQPGAERRELNSAGGRIAGEAGHDAVSAEVYAELLRSPDEGVAEFLDLARVKPNTLGNTRMIRRL